MLRKVLLGTTLLSFGLVQGAMANEATDLEDLKPSISTPEPLSGILPDLDDLWIIEVKLRGRNTILSDVIAFGDGQGDNLFVPILQLSLIHI